MRVLLVEDDPLIGRSLTRAFEGSGAAVDWARAGDDALAALSTSRYAIVLLDLGLPDRAGLDVLKEMRCGKDATPVLIVTARDDLETRVAGLDLGADDFIVKPFDFDELAARMRAVIRRHAGHSTSQISSSEIILDLAAHEVTYKGATQLLPAREFALLQALLERPGTILSRQQLEDALYGWGEEVESNAVDVLIHYIRRKFGNEIIRNVRGVGWMVAR
ncbi:response regulator transcription factor [Microvirga lotononidis]|uniref:Response regulator with CheY-like receiver domain and winged-helix DNA-binding domain n=1 Tax=Microvirga lotononidis TaxID=864069 RepID=I4YVI0_9HYPH|nr:response regulator transcription factor [Microvirga lotononidis]EIM27972.1 response regulator with CheY-like receiver domain and winged-helix DNA-binding domain [Microvirga lotononidis]WQO27909.1 response regulator transcription factor [Microvirga lotononidis]